MIDKRNCTVETIGKVVKLLDKGIHSATVITVLFDLDTLRQQQLGEKKTKGD